MSAGGGALTSLGLSHADPDLHTRADRPNLFIKIPGTAEGLPAIEEAIAAGVPVYVTLLFSADHYTAAAEASMRSVERRIAAGQDPAVGSVASIFMSRWDVAIKDDVPAPLRDKLAVAVGTQAYRAYRDVLDSDRWQRLENRGARAQRLLFASTSTKDPEAPDTMYVHDLGAANAVNTIPGDAPGLLRPRPGRRAADGRWWKERRQAEGVPGRRSGPGCTGCLAADPGR